MTKQEIQEFIDRMEEIGDVWSEEQVEDVFGNKSLEEALKERRSQIGSFFDIIGKAINR